MSLEFYPSSDEARKGSLTDRIEILAHAAVEFKAAVMSNTDPHHIMDRQVPRIPREQTIAFNWEEMARVLREVRTLPEINRADKIQKATLLTHLAEIYETLRAAKMSKLEAVRIALISEANQLNSQAAQVA